MTEPRIHPTAIVAPGARLAEGVTIGPYAVVEDEVEIGAGTRLGPHVVVHRLVRMGAENVVHAHAVLGDLPQDLTFDDRETWVEIGDANVLREGVTIHRATQSDAPTRLGSRCFLMAYSHIGHDCQVGDGVVLTNNVCLGGHVEIGDHCNLGGTTSVHQFVRVGAHAMVAGYLAVRKDVLPFSLVGGEPIRHYRLNSIGLRRRGITGERYRALENAFRGLRAGKDLNGIPPSPEVEFLQSWLARPSRRGRYGFV